MEKLKQIISDAVPEPAAKNFSNALKLGNQLFMSGMTASDPSADAYSQSLECLEKIQEMVNAAGGKMTDVVKISVFLTDVHHRTEFSRARDQYFPGRKPCSTLVGINALARPGLVVEVEALAFIGAGD